MSQNRIVNLPTANANGPVTQPKLYRYQFYLRGPGVDGDKPLGECCAPNIRTATLQFLCVIADHCTEVREFRVVRVESLIVTPN